jgi:mannose-6-phosphate isomerase-like protein (cupin superfamily)
MPTRIVSANTAEHYTWGGRDGAGCDGWHLVKTPSLSVIEERMPSGTRETRHSHVHAHQFFFVLEGELTLEVEGQRFVITAGEGLEVRAGQPHQAENPGPSPVRMIVTSQPPSHGDRVNA